MFRPLKSSRRGSLPFYPEEDHDARHQRRLNTANKSGCRKYAKDRLERLGYSVDFSRMDVWRIFKGVDFVGKWVPSMGLLVIGDDLMVKVHEVFQLVHEMEAWHGRTSGSKGLTA